MTDVRSALRWLLSATLALPACGGDADATAPGPLLVPDDGLPAECHPFRSASVCAMPWPSSIDLAADAGTRTGVRVDLAGPALPVSAASGAAVDPTRWNRHDGYSWATPILAWFPERIDPASLPSQHDDRPGLDPGSATVIVDVATGERVPHFAELDVSAEISDDERQPLMIRPLVHLRPATRYAVGVTDTLRTTTGATPARPSGFASALRGGKVQGARHGRALAALPAVLGALETAGAPRESLLLAWDFTTNSVEDVTAPVLHMRDVALAATETGPVPHSLGIVDHDPFADTTLRALGTFRVTSFLSNDDRSVPESELVLDAAGLPVRTRDTDFPFRLIIPHRVLTTGPVDHLLVYGHGLLEDNEAVDDSYVRQLCEERGYIAIGTDWIGLSSTENVGVGASAAAVEAVKDLNHIGWVTDRYQQALVNFMVLVRAARSILKEPALALPDGRPPISDAFTPVYYGISQGGIMGPSLLAYSPDLVRGVAQAGGTAYSLMIQRSVHWTEFYPSMRNAFPDRTDQQLVMALWQAEFDRSEGAGTVWSQGAHDPLPGTQRKGLLLQFGVGDSQVPNLAAAIQARTLGLQLIGPSPVQVWGVGETTADADQGISAWDLVREPAPESNATPATDNGVHDDVRFLPQNQEQTDVFLKTGGARNTCGGACVFPGYVR